MKAPSEKHLEDWIVDNPSKAFYQLEPYEDKWDGRMPLFETLIARQAKLPSGICDLVAIDTGEGFDCIYAVELKKGAIDSDAICQCMRYMYDFKDMVKHAKMHTSHHAFEYPLHFSQETKGIVIGHSLSDGNLVKSAEAAHILLVTYEYLENGEYVFEAHENWRENHHETMIEYSYGIIGRSIQNIVNARIAHHEEYPHG